MRAVRAPAGVSLVPRQARLPVPSRPHQRHCSRSRPAEGPTYLREDEILPHLAALAILRAESGTPDRARRAGITAPARVADLIEQLRAGGVVLTYDPQDRTLRADGRDRLFVATGRNRWEPDQGKEAARRGRRKSTRCGRRLSAGDDRACPRIAARGGFNVSEDQLPQKTHTHVF